jgi:hypothetical protein
MSRINQRDLEKLCEHLNTLTDNKPEFLIEYAYGRPRLVSYCDKEKGTIKDVSPRLPKPQLYDWLHAYIDGIGLGHELATRGA